MTCDCAPTHIESAAQRKMLRMALTLNAAMFVIGTLLGYWAQSTGVLADALDMLTDAIAYGLALQAASRGAAFKRHSAQYSGLVLLLLGAGIAAQALWRWYAGSQPVGPAMMAYAVVSFAVNVYVLAKLTRFRHDGVHLSASYLCTRADVLANIAVFVCGGVIVVTGAHWVDLLVGFAIALYVFKEAGEILRQARLAR